jgi:hypothetical protein
VDSLARTSDRVTPRAAKRIGGLPMGPEGILYLNALLGRACPPGGATGHKALGRRLRGRLVWALRFRRGRCEMMVGTRQAVRCGGGFHQGGFNRGTFDTGWYQKEEG